MKGLNSNKHGFNHKIRILKLGPMQGRKAGDVGEV